MCLHVCLHLFLFTEFTKIIYSSRPFLKLFMKTMGLLRRSIVCMKGHTALVLRRAGGGGGGSPTPTPTSQDQLCRYVRTPVAYLCLHGNRLPSISTQYESVTSTIVLLLLPVLAYLYHEFHAFMRQTHGIYLNVAIHGCLTLCQLLRVKQHEAFLGNVTSNIKFFKGHF